MADWDKGISIRPAQCEHPEPRLAFHGAVVKDICRQFHLFGTGTAEQAVVNNEYIFALFIGQWFHEVIDYAGGE